MTKKRFNSRGQQRDLNEPGIIAILCSYGWYVQQMDKSAGFDVLAGHIDKLRGWVLQAIEVKNPEGKTLTRAELEKMLTKNERETKELIEAAGGEYLIWQSDQDALAAVGVDTGS